MMIERYGQEEHFPDGGVFIFQSAIPEHIMLESVNPHVWLCPAPEGETGTWYKLLRGVRTYNTKEMSILIDGTVQEAKEQGLRIKASREIEEMLKNWHPHK